MACELKDKCGFVKLIGGGDCGKDPLECARRNFQNGIGQEQIQRVLGHKIANNATVLTHKGPLTDQEVGILLDKKIIG